jgi:membrane-associated phospholipid phosphatase
MPLTNADDEEYESFSKLSSNLRKLIKCLSFVFLTFAYLLMGFSRFALGAHSANQIIYGFIVGLWSCLACVHLINPFIVECL